MVTLVSRDAEEAVAAFPPTRRWDADIDRTAPFVNGTDVEAFDEEVLAGGEIVHCEVQRLAPETAVAEERRHDTEGGMDPGLVPGQLSRCSQRRAVAVTGPMHPTTHREGHERSGPQVAQRSDKSERGDGYHDGLGPSPFESASSRSNPTTGLRRVGEATTTSVDAPRALRTVNASSRETSSVTPRLLA